MKLLHFLLYTLVLSFCFGQFGRLPFSGGQVGIYVWDILAAALVIYWLCIKLAVEKKLELPPLSGRIFLFAFIALISLVNGKRWIGVGEWVVAGGYWIRWVIYAGVYFVVSDLNKGISNFQFLISNLLVLSGIVLAILGFVQLAVFPNLSELDPQLGWDPHQGRMVSTWLDPNFLGAYFVLCLSLLIGTVFSALENTKSEFLNSKQIQNPNVQNSKRLGHLNLGNLKLFRISGLGFRIFFLTTYCLILTAGLLLTFSRSAWAMFAIVIGIFGLFKSRKLLFLMAALFFGSYFLVPRVQTRLAGITDPADSASLRLVSWQRTLEIIKEHPLTGVGFNAFRYAQEREGFFRDERGVPQLSGHAGAGSDSSLLLVWATTGVFGFLAYLWLYGGIAWKALKNLGEGGGETRPGACPPQPGGRRWVIRISSLIRHS